MANILCAELVLPTLTLDTVQSYPMSNFHPSTVGHIHLVFTMLSQDDESFQSQTSSQDALFLCWMIRYFVSNQTHPGKTWKFFLLFCIVYPRPCCDAKVHGQMCKTQHEGCRQMCAPYVFLQRKFPKVPSGKLTWQWNIPILCRQYIFQWSISIAMLVYRSVNRFRYKFHGHLLKPVSSK